jgi:Spy/CpxP family protein refolding chaperone
MKKSHSLAVMALAGLFAMRLETRAEDPILPPKPPGGSAIPAAPAAPAVTTTPTAPSGTSQPAAPAGGGGRAGEFVKMLREKLGVTDDQLEKMKPIFEQQRDKMMGLKDDTALTMEQKREKAIGIFTETMEELKPILTPEQFAKFKEEMEKRRAARQRKPE